MQGARRDEDDLVTLRQPRWLSWSTGGRPLQACRGEKMVELLPFARDGSSRPPSHTLSEVLHLNHHHF